jgi:uncharacterized Zn finger protein
MVDLGRMRRGIEIAAEGRAYRIYPDNLEYYEVEGNSGTYTVTYDPATGVYKCTCPDHEHRGIYCQHIFAVIGIRESL